jgi:hypothetical protein
MTHSLRKVFAAPAVLAAASGVGLVAALVADGPGDVVSWLTRGAAVAVCGYYALRRAGRGAADAPAPGSAEGPGPGSR